MAPFTDLSSKRLSPRYRQGHPQFDTDFSPKPPSTMPPAVATKIRRRDSHLCSLAFAEIFPKAAAFPRRCLPLATHLVPTLERHAPEPMKHSNPSWRFRCRLRLFRHQPCRAACLHRVKLAPGLSGDATLLGRFLNRKLVRSVPHSKGYFRSRGLLFFMAQLRKERG
jgi:hypothetical protein